MRTTVRLFVQLVSYSQRLAVVTGRKLNAIFEIARREKSARDRSKSDRLPSRLTTVSGHGLMPGVNLDNSAKLLQIMEDADGPYRS